MPGVVDVDTTLVVGKPELSVAHRPRQGGGPGRAACRTSPRTLSVLVGGQKVSTYKERGEQYDVHVRAERGVPRRRGGHRAR